MELSKQFYYKHNRLQQLRGFYYTVQNGGNISRAAAEMGLTQVAVTLQIQSLERDLNIKLFKRSKKRIEITKEGEVFYKKSAEYIQGIDELFKNFASNIKEEKSNIIDIAANHVSISYILPKYIKEFKDFNLDIKFKIRNLSKDDALKRLIKDEIDMFIYPMQNNEIPSEFEFIPIVKYKPILLIRKDHPLAKKKEIKLIDVQPYELIRIDPKFITLPFFEEITESYNLKSSFRFEMSDWEILKKFVNAKIGVAIISDIILEGESKSELIGKSLNNYFPDMIYGILFKKGKIFNNLTKEFINLLQKKKFKYAF